VTVSAGIHRDLGLSDDELESITGVLGREPLFTELAMFSVMWSEHCSYKSSRRHLRSLPTAGRHVVVGPGEGAGIVEVAPGVRVAWKVESHNHPSFVEPVNGAATGVGGIVRDIVSMGARPLALLDSLRFGPLDDARTRYLVEGVVSGISSYGNSIGVPTVGGETDFDPSYAGNPLVNVACLGIVEGDVQQGRADRIGDAFVLIGSTTGRDGIGGASVLASAEFDDASSDKRPSVQVGDPFTEKLLIEATLELARRGLLTGLQDLGAGGLTCPVAEMTSKSGTGAAIDIDRVARREPGMEPFEVMISESQERMLATVEPARLEEVLALCSRWEIGAATVGEVTETGRVTVSSRGEVVADAPAGALADEAPVLDRPRERPGWLDDLQALPSGARGPSDLARAFLDVLGAPAVASRRWVWEQYDHMIMLGTIEGPGGDAAVVRLPDRDATVAVSVDGPGRFCALDPYAGALLAVAEAARNVACTGARPVAVTDCLNFGSPERPEVMWQFTETVRGLGDACRAFGTPVTGGNVSFYNETDGRAVHPTPVIGMLGVLDSPDNVPGAAFRADGDVVVLAGRTDEGDFGGSEYAYVTAGVVAGSPPEIDLGAERALHAFLHDACAARLLHSAHDLSDGGLAVALAESALRGGRGFSLDPRDVGEPWRHLFSETPSRALLSCPPGVLEDLVRLGTSHAVGIEVLGTTGGDVLGFGSFSVALDRARRVWEGSLEAAVTASG
jgi:phosphoribosylformylglycinamidine synthase subunit PurL